VVIGSKTSRQVNDRDKKHADAQSQTTWVAFSWICIVWFCGQSMIRWIADSPGAIMKSSLGYGLYPSPMNLIVAIMD
jgi:hypothetical protein